MATNEERAALRIEVRSSPETNYHEVLLFGGEQNLVDRFGDGAIGLDPDDILLAPCALLEEGPHKCLIGRCSCGVIGCGDVVVETSVRDGVVRWAATAGPRDSVYFDLEAYRTEVRRALGDHSWETPERTAARLIREGVDRDALRRHGFTFTWASGRADARVMTVALWLEPGPYQVLVRLPCDVNDNSRAPAKAMLALLNRSPSQWPDVVWYRQEATLGPPAMAGAGWRSQ